MAIQLSLDLRTATGKKLKDLRAAGLIPSVIYGDIAPTLASSNYNATEKVLEEVGFHSPVELSFGGKKQLAIVKNVDRDAVSRRILNIEFQAISADEIVEATTPIKIVDFDVSEAAKKHFVILQVLEEIDVKAHPSDLPEELIVSGAKLENVDDKLTVADIVLPAKVELADKELAENTAVANVYDPAAEAAAREEEDKKQEGAEEKPADAE